jgi:two-component system OmpR family sensor kinase
LARLDQERPLRLETIDVAHVVRTAVSAAQAGWKGHAVVLHITQTVEVRCDGERLRQVLDNLLANALNHSPPDAAVNVRVCRIDGGRVRIEVADQGPGVATEDAERIFEPFFRTDLARVRDTGGTGLGLSIVASIAQAHGGLVGVDPNDGGGALFWFEFPADVDIPQRERRHAWNRRNKRIRHLFRPWVSLLQMSQDALMQECADAHYGRIKPRCLK